MATDRHDGQPAWAYEMEIALMTEMQVLKESIPTEDRIRMLAREEQGIATKNAWNARSALIAIIMFCVTISTFMLTVFRGGHP